MRRSTALAIGVALTLAFAGLAALLVFATEHLHPWLLLIVVILSQLRCGPVPHISTARISLEILWVDAL
jgi:hypothetical protein